MVYIHISTMDMITKPVASFKAIGLIPVKVVPHLLLAAPATGASVAAPLVAMGATPLAAAGFLAAAAAGAAAATAGAGAAAGAVTAAAAGACMRCLLRTLFGMRPYPGGTLPSVVFRAAGTLGGTSGGKELKPWK
jgi:hypothetical protein